MRDNVIRAAHRFPLGKIRNTDTARVCPLCHRKAYYPDTGCLKCGHTEARP